MAIDYLERARNVIDLEVEGLRAMASRLGPELGRAVEMLLLCVIGGDKIVATGVGKSGHIAEKVAATLTSTGAPCVYLNCVNAVHGDLGIVSEGDVLILFSYSGETEEIVRTLPSLRRPSGGVIALTGNPQSTLALGADVHLNVHVDLEACPLRLAPTASTTAMLAMGDALAMVLLEARGFTKEQFAQYHPGGAIGKSLLLRVTDVMRSADKLATVPETGTVLDAVKAMGTARAGAACILRPDGTLAGIFTHGDFARHYQLNESIGTTLVAEIMTRKPITVFADKLAVEALRLFENHAIDDLVVINEKGIPVGLVDAQDLAKHKLV